MAVSILQKAINANDWAKFMEALDDFSIYINAGGDKYNQELNDLVYDMLATKAQALLKKNKGDCLSFEDYAAQDLVERLSNPKDTFSLQLSQKFKAKFGSKLLDDLAMGVKSCTYELSMNSKLTMTAEGSTLTTNASAASIKLFPIYSKGEIFLWGGDKMQMDSKMSGLCSFPFKHYDTLMFMVQRLAPVYEDGVLVDFHLSGYFVQGWKKSVTIAVQGENKDCPTLVRLSGGGDYWTGIFTVARIQSPIVGWKVTNNLTNGARLTADWRMVSPGFSAMGVSGVTLTEDTLFQLKITKNKK
jgi:hypothetical protein